MQLDMEEHCKGNCFAINYEELPDPRASENFRYSLSSNKMRISPKKRFVNDEEINHQKGLYNVNKKAVDVSLLFFVRPDDDEYIRNGFLTLQHVIDRQYMRYQEVNSDYELLLNSMPNLEVGTSDSNRMNYFGTLLSVLFSTLLLSTFVVPFVEEKQNGLKEYLNLVTPMSFFNGLTFFLIRFVCYAIFLILTLSVAWKYGTWGLIGFQYILPLYMLYIIANMSYAYLISVCFHTGKF